MRVVLLVFVVVGAAGLAFAQDPTLRPRERLFGGVESDRALIRTCMSREAQNCDSVVQDACQAEAAARGEDLTGVFARACDERAIAVWEDEMNVSLASLRSKLSGRDLEDLERSQQAWRAAVLADVQLARDSFQGGTGAGRAADEAEARATARRAMFLADLDESF